MFSLCFEYFLYLWQNRVVHARLLLSLPSSEIGDSFRDPGSLYWKIVCGSGNVLITSRVLLLPDHLSGRCVHTHAHVQEFTALVRVCTQIYIPLYFCIPLHLVKTTGFIISTFSPTPQGSFLFSPIQHL